jgi:hypothetical protein
MTLAVYISHRCSNCSRLLNYLKRIPSLADTRVIDIDRYPAQGIEYVPTLVDESGVSHVGSKAFEFLKKYEAEITLEGVQLGSGQLAFGSISSGGELEYQSPFGADI